MTSYDLAAGYGINETLDIEGALTELRVIAGAPVVFLIDEHHTTPACIQENILNAQVLINDAGVQLLGVESHEAGQPAAVLTLVNAAPGFANHFIGQGVAVEGVESRAMSDELEMDVINAIWPGITVQGHPNNLLRSYYFIASLFKARRRLALGGNSILNMGRSHTDHIVQLINWGAIDTVAGVVASYVRIRPTSHP